MSPYWRIGEHPKFDDAKVERLIQQRRDDTQGLEEILEACLPVIHIAISARAISIPGYELQDLVQEALMQLMKAFPRYQSRGRTFSFVYTVCLYLFFNLSRKHANRRLLLLEDYADVFADQIAELADHRPDPLRMLIITEEIIGRSRPAPAEPPKPKLKPLSFKEKVAATFPWLAESSDPCSLVADMLAKNGSTKAQTLNGHERKHEPVRLKTKSVRPRAELLSAVNIWENEGGSIPHLFDKPKIRASQKGRPGNRRGAILSAETRSKIGRSKLGRKLPPFTAEHKQRIREAKQGAKNGMFGKVPWNKKNREETRRST